MNHAQDEQPRPEIVPGDRIFLSNALPSDVPTYARWFSDLELTAYLGQVGTTFTLEQEQEWFDNRFKDPNTRNFAIVVRESRQMIGNVSLMNINHQRGVSELGIAIGEKSAWGKGYGSEAVRLITDYGFTFLGLNTIYLWHTSFNERGHKAYLKAGFKLAGRLREASVFDGQRYDHILMDITRAEFGPSRLRGLIGQLQENQP